MLNLDPNSQMNVLSHLNAKDILACKLVNTDWCNVIQKLWRFVVTRVSIPDDFLNLEVPVSEHRLKAILGSLGPKLISLKISDLLMTVDNFTCETIAEIPVMFPNLSCLHLEVPLDCTSCMPVGLCQSLQCLTCDFGDLPLSQQKNKVMHQWNNILSNLPCLKEFSLVSARLFASGLEELSEFCKTVTKLSFVSVQIIDYDSFKRFLQKCSNLSDFSFMDIQDEIGQLRVDALPSSLCSLHLRGVQSIHSARKDCIQKVYSHFDGLKKLTLSQLPVQLPDLFGMYALCDLKYLDLSHHNCDSTGIRTIALAPFKLFHLDLSSHRPFLDDALSLLAKEQNQLRVLNISCARSCNFSSGFPLSFPNECLTGRFLLDLIFLNPNLTALGLAYVPIKYLEEYIRGITSLIKDTSFTENIDGGDNNSCITAGDGESSMVRLMESSNLLIYVRGTLPYNRCATLSEEVNGRIRLTWDSCEKPFHIPEKWTGIPESPMSPGVLSFTSDRSSSGSEEDEAQESDEGQEPHGWEDPDDWQDPYDWEYPCEWQEPDAWQEPEWVLDLLFPSRAWQ